MASWVWVISSGSRSDSWSWDASPAFVWPTGNLYVTARNTNNATQSGAKVVLYAPTWAATHAAMDYSSVAASGKAIARAFLNRPDYYFIYRPHPSVGTSSAVEREADDEIRAAVTRNGLSTRK